MLQRVTKFSKKTEADAPVFASVSASDIIRAPVVHKTIPLGFAALLAPYKRRGRLSLRVEDVPQRARLSAGRNNGDGSWSLASDELEDLAYLVPANLVREHTLLVRIMAFEEGAASTLKVIHFPVPLEPEPAAQDDAAEPGAHSPDPILHNELECMQSLFAVRESELTELRVALEQAEALKESELAGARAAWELELKKRLSEAVTQARQQVEAERQRWKTENAAALSEALAQERVRWQDEAGRGIETERQRWKAESAGALSDTVAQERARWQDEADRRNETERQRREADSAGALSGAVARERARWQEETDRRNEAERQRGKTESADALSEAVAQERVRWQEETDRHNETERQRWKTESADALSEAVAQERARWQEETDRHNETERQRWKTESADALSEAIGQERTRWQQEIDRRLEAERQRLKTKSAGTLSDSIAEERAVWQEQADRQIEAERQLWKTESAVALSETVAKEQKRWQSEMDQRINAEHQHWKAESLAALSQAEARRKADEADRSAAILAETHEQSRSLADAARKCAELELALVEARVRPNNPPAIDTGEAESGRLRGELAKMRSVPTQRENELAGHRTASEQERERWRRELETAITAAAKAWKTEEDARLAAIVEKSRTESDATLAVATWRYEAAERALAESGKQDTAPARKDDGYVESLRRELSTVRGALVNCEVELGQARRALERTRPQPIQSAVSNPVLSRNLADPGEEDVAASKKRGLVRDFVVAVCVITPILFFYPWLEVYLPEEVRTSITSMTGSLLGTGAPPALPIQAAAPPAPPVVKQQTAIVSRAANLRATAATTGAVVLTLQRGAPVTVLERRGNWTLVEVPSKDGKTKALQGFVYGSYLKDKS
jgi:hypothetical protein